VFLSLSYLLESDRTTRRSARAERAAARRAAAEGTPPPSEPKLTRDQALRVMSGSKTIPVSKLKSAIADLKAIGSSVAPLDARQRAMHNIMSKSLKARQAPQQVSSSTKQPEASAPQMSKEKRKQLMMRRYAALKAASTPSPASPEPSPPESPKPTVKRRITVKPDPRTNVMDLSKAGPNIKVGEDPPHVAKDPSTPSNPMKLSRRKTWIRRKKSSKKR
jgi:hypothetical protein